MVRNGLVENVIIWDGLGEWKPEEGCVAIRSDDAQIGWVYDGETFSPPERYTEEPGLVHPPESVTRRQFALELLGHGIVSADEAVALAARAEPPEMMASFIATMPKLEQAMARIDMAADNYAIDNPLILSLFSALGKSESERDAFFVSAAAR